MFWTKNAGYVARKSLYLSNAAFVGKCSVPGTGFQSSMHVRALNMQGSIAQVADMPIILLRKLMIFSGA